MKLLAENLRQLLHNQSELSEQAETRWRKAQRVLEALLETFAPEEVELRLKAGLPMDNLAVDELEQLIRQTVGERFSAGIKLLNENHTIKAHQELYEQLAKLQGDLKEARTENLRLTDRITQLESEQSRLLSQISALQQVTSLNSWTEVKVDAGESIQSGYEAAQAPEPE